MIFFYLLFDCCIEREMAYLQQSINQTMHVQKAPSWLRAVQIGLGALTIALSIFALVEFQSSPYVRVLNYEPK